MLSESTKFRIWDASESRKCRASQQNLEFGMSQRVESAERVNEILNLGWPGQKKVLSESTKIEIQGDLGMRKYLTR